MKKLAIVALFLFIASTVHAHDPSIAAGKLFKGLVTPMSKGVKEAIKNFKKHQKKKKYKRNCVKKVLAKKNYKSYYRHR